MQTKEFKANKVNSGDNDCMLIFDPAKYFYEDLALLFINLKPRNEKFGQFYIDSVIIFGLFDDIIGFKKHAYKPDSSSKRSPWKFLNSLNMGIGARKKADIILEEKPAGFDDIVVG